MTPHEPIPLDAIQAARERLAGAVLRPPLVRLNVDDQGNCIFNQPVCGASNRGSSPL